MVFVEGTSYTWGAVLYLVAVTAWLFLGSPTNSICFDSYDLALLVYLPPTVLLMAGARAVWRTQARPFGKELIKQRFTEASEEVVNAKADRFAVVSFKAVWFTLEVGLLFPYLSALPWWPTAFGGAGGKGIWELTTPCEAVVNVYYVVGMAYHLQSFLFHALSSEMVKLEMLLHDAVTLSLVISSFRYNMMRIGVVVMFLFDAGDLAAYLTKTFVDTPYKKTTYTIYAGLMTSWGYLRMYGLPVVVLREIWEIEVARNFPAVCKNSSYNPEPLRWGMFTLISLLYLLNIFWYILLAKTGCESKKRGPVDIVDHQIEKEGSKND